MSSRSFFGGGASSSGSASVPARDRLFTGGQVPVTTRCMASQSGPATSSATGNGLSDGSTTSRMHRLKVTVTADATDLRLVYANYVYGQPGAQTIFVTAAIELDAPSAVFPVTFAGLTELTLNPDGIATSDPVPFPVAKGDTLWIRTYVRVTTLTEKWPVSVQYWQTGEAVSGTTDLTAATGTAGLTTPPTAPAVYGFAPVAMLGTPDDVDTPVVALWGDSITAGWGNGEGNYVYASWSEEAIAGSVPWFNLARHNENLGSMTPVPANGLTTFAPTAFRHKMRLAQCCTHLISGYGANDFNIGSMAVAVMQANYLTHWTQLAGRGLKIWQVTITPRVGTTTDGWRTTGGQTFNTNEAVRTGCNDWIRDGAPILAGAAVAVGSSAPGTLRAGQVGHPLVGYLETADLVESARNSGKWKTALRTVTDAAITNGAATLTSATGAFTSADLGRRVAVMGAGSAGAVLSATIRTVNSGTSVALSGNAATTVSGATAGIGIWTSDGVHPSRTGHLAMVAALNPAIFTT